MSEPPPQQDAVRALPPGLQGRQLAGFGERLAAALVDALLMVLLAPTIVGPLVYGALLTRRAGERNGQTLGKQLLGLRAVREDGRPYDLGSAFVREGVLKCLLFGLISAFVLGIPTLLDAMWPLWDERRQALHDKLASSYVVKA